MRSRVGKIETSFDTLKTEVHPIQPVRHVSVLILQAADALFYLADVVTRSVDYAADVAKMLKNNVVGLNHCLTVSQGRLL
jgi:hypothetical protein